MSSGTTSIARFILAHSALAAANALLGIGSVVSKIGLAGCNPVIFALLRELLAAPLLFVLSVMVEGVRGRTSGSEVACGFTRTDGLQFFTAGAMLFGTNLGYIIGVKFLGAAAASIWQSALPIFGLVLSVSLGYEQLSTLKVLGVLTAFAGCAFVVLYSGSGDGEGEAEQTAEAARSELTGHLIFLVQVTALALFFIAEKPLLQRWTPLATLAYSYAVASSLMLLAGVVINSTPALLDVICPDCHGDGWSVPSESLLAIGYWVLFGSAIAYFLATWGNQYVDATMVTAYFTVQPIASVLASIAIIATTPPPHMGMEGPGLQDLGALGIFAGVGLLIYDARSRSPTAAAAHADPTRPYERFVAKDEAAALHGGQEGKRALRDAPVP